MQKMGYIGRIIYAELSLKIKLVFFVCKKVQTSLQGNTIVVINTNDSSVDLYIDPNICYYAYMYVKCEYPYIGFIQWEVKQINAFSDWTPFLDSDKNGWMVLVFKLLAKLENMFQCLESSILRTLTIIILRLSFCLKCTFLIIV